MEIRVKVATILLSKASPPLEKSDFSIEVPEGSDVEAIVSMIGVPHDLVGSITVNKRRSSPQKILAEGDLVAILPAISGG